MNYLLAILISFSLCSCALFDKRLVDAKSYIEAHKYEEAIELLEGYSGSEAAQKLLSEAYLGSGITTLKNLNLPIYDRYQICKQKFAKALDTNPHSTKARDYYQMIIKTMEHLEAKV